MRHITPEGLALIMRFEGFSPIAYRCPAGYDTIGYGHVIRPQESFTRIDETLARQLLIQDVSVSEKAVLRLISVPLTPNQFDALVSFTYNVGAGALQRSQLRQKINSNQIIDINREFMKWVYAAGRKLPGLVLRRKAESHHYFNLY